MKFFLKLLGGNGNDQTDASDKTEITNGTSGSLGADTDDLSTIISTIQSVISVGLGIITAGVVILSVFIAYKFFTAETEDKRKNAKAQLIYAIIGIVILLALMALAPALTNAAKNAMLTK